MASNFHCVSSPFRAARSMISSRMSREWTQRSADLTAWARETRSRLGSHLRIVAITAEDGISDQPGIVEVDAE
jgi:hypothetical protein